MGKEILINCRGISKGREWTDDRSGYPYGWRTGPGCPIGTRDDKAV